MASPDDDAAEGATVDDAAEGATGDDAPAVLDLPIGIDATGERTETDAMGAITVPADRYWGAQTQRSLVHFDIGDERMPKEVYHAYGHVKKAAAIVNTRMGLLPAWMGSLIERVCDEVIAGELDEHFPLYVYQTGSGTQSNMNLNEVISNRSIQLVGGELGSKSPVHPNDHVNESQSSNDTFPAAMHIATVKAVEEELLPSLRRLRDVAAAKSAEWADVVKIGRTHLQDATPLTVGQEWSAYVAQLDDAIDDVRSALPSLHRLALGGTAVGTGLNAPEGFAEQTAAVIAEQTGYPFVTAPNKFAAQASLDPMVRMSGRLRNVTVVLFKFANDLRWLGSGPRTGLHELLLPDNEPGSSMMPGKVNPTQAEAMLMVSIQVIGLDTAVAMAGQEGNFQLNAFRPIIINNVLHSIRIIADAVDRFRAHMVEGTQLNEAQIATNIERSVMMVTALSPHVGYDEASRIAHLAIEEDLTLREAALRSEKVTEELFDRVVIPADLTRPTSSPS